MSLLSPELAGGFFITVPPGKPILKEKLNLKIKKINWEFEMDWDFGISRSIICRLDKRQGPIQCPVTDHNGKEFISVTKSLCCTAEANTL